MRVRSSDRDRLITDRDDQNTNDDLSEERGEEPTVMMIDSVIGDD